ncbi:MULTISPECIES: phosphate uptake regulator PhoU [Haloferax]|jgi:phosphate uptake regulator|uniref:AbrB/MazE/SpoVT family DNA-binding domain-containing protein n=4 Tax=Haloferax TaxID=2251 RepID=A0A6C0UUY0_HALVO|nr:MULTISPECIES: phosphate uptake regulator PhoU [Haloferax]ELK55899.1 transcriptional regulator [Haloferax sp. BAB-2207]ELZ76212.1 transcriptional regulator [Haloferax lucentense DSM 14919]ELZ87063.1 transcriptional regulator [Haloferax alexandrinus JCM 10717]MBC9987059.1 phosphate uptake regulator PhoU [Haloferax sp. AS1]NLV03954.1 AbrB/MazE/SpoVT family DNA-binding domain-containing protein [Haloferax alexandrinus]
MVETRKVQVTGGSTYTVSIPKDWATDNGVSAGSEVEFYPEGDSLFLTPRSEEERTEGTLDIATLEGDELTRAVMTMYVSGFDIIALESSRITTDQRRTIREATQSLVGLEVLEETRDRVVIRDLLDSSELSIHNAVTRMRLIALSMLEDAIAAIAEQDDDMARDVIQRDDDVDRLWMVVSRIFRATLRTPKAAEELGLPREICFDYQSAARQLERIGDHATKIAHLSLNFEEPVDGEIVEAIQELFKDTESVVNGGMDALFAEESDEASRLANESREAVQAIDASARGIDELLRDLDPARAQLLGLIVDSVSRSADYGGNIAETALQKAAPTP